MGTHHKHVPFKWLADALNWWHGVIRSHTLVEHPITGMQVLLCAPRWFSPWSDWVPAVRYTEDEPWQTVSKEWVYRTFDMPKDRDARKEDQDG